MTRLKVKEGSECKASIFCIFIGFVYLIISLQLHSFNNIGITFSAFHANIFENHANSSYHILSDFIYINKSYLWDELIECALVYRKPSIKCIHNIDINSLTNQTIKHLQSINYTQYHKLISLRRKIMLVYEVLNIKKSNTYNQMLTYFKTIKEYNNILQIKQKHKLFHIHFSKAAGTSIIDTLKYYNHNNEIYESNDIFNSNCSTLYQKVYNSFALTRENSLFPISKLNIPILCDEFIYIMPIRAPIERICSQTEQFDNDNVLARISFFKQLPKNTNFTETKCNQWLIDGIPFKKLTKFEDFQNIYVSLLNSEHYKFYKKYNVKSYHDVVKRIYNLSLSSKETHITNKCANLAQYMNCRYFPFNVSFNSNGKLNIKHSKYVVQTPRFRQRLWGGYVDISWLRTKMGSNIYTSYLGYSQQSEDECVVLSNYVCRKKINFTHFINAMKLIFEIDYILPMELYSNDIWNEYKNMGYIWNISFKQITSFIQQTYGANDKLQQNNWIHSNKANKNISRNICNHMSEYERKLLEKYNQFDIEIYRIGRLIENVDVKFYLYNEKAQV
eukprot:547317_1